MEYYQSANIPVRMRFNSLTKSSDLTVRAEVMKSRKLNFLDGYLLNIATFNERTNLGQNFRAPIDLHVF